jgi:cyclophilin family peptidyl-prolyl cis-trans isomerase
MRRIRHALLAALTAAALATLSACGSDAEPAGSPAPPVATTTGGAEGTVTASNGETCVSRAPSPAPDPKTYAEPPALGIDTNATYRATLLTSCGPIVIALDAARAPVTVNNFVFLAREGFFDGLTFHRVITGYIIQGGDPEGTGRGGPGYAIPDELPDDGYPPGAVAMANAGPDSAGSQFFIVTGDASALPNAYAKLGRVVKGLDVARTIESFADPIADPGDPDATRPTSPVYIYKVLISGP